MCGSDAVDKRTSTQYGSWQRYRGCGRSFLWSQALPCRPIACQGKPGGSVALAETVGTEPYDEFFRQQLVDNEDTEVAESLITLRYLPSQPDILLLACKYTTGPGPALGLVAAKANVGEVDGESPLMLACENQWPELVAALVAAKASTTYHRKDGNTPLLLACANMCTMPKGSPEVLTALLSAGADVRERLPNGKSALLLACATHADPTCISVLAEAGAELDIRRKDGQTPLLLACGNNCERVVEILLRAKADANMDVVGRSPLLVACEQSNPRCVQPLLEAKADTKITDAHGRGPVELISRHSKSSLPTRRDASVVKALVSAKAHISVNHGDWQVRVRDRAAFASALEMARGDVSVVHNNCLDAVAALLKAKADPCGHGGEIAVLSLKTTVRRSRPLQQLLAVSETENSFKVCFSFKPPDNCARVRPSMRQILEAGPSDDCVKPSRSGGSTDRLCLNSREKLYGHLDRNTPHGKSSGRNEFVARQKKKAYKQKRDPLLKNKCPSKPKRAWHALRGKRMYQREWS